MTKLPYAVLAFCLMTSAYAVERPLSVDDIINMTSVGGNIHLAPDGYDETVLMSPDGQQVFFSMSTADWEVNQRKSTFYLIDSNGENLLGLPQLDGGSGFRYSPQGDYISFTRAVDGIVQIFAMSVKSGEITRLSDHSGDVFAYVWAADESAIFFAADDVRNKEEQRKYELGENWFFVDEGSNGRIGRTLAQFMAA